MCDLLNKAKFKARRGLNELDKIFVPFVEKRFLSLGNSQVDQLFELFEIDDVSLADIIIYKKMDYQSELKEIFEEIEQYWDSFKENHDRFSDKQVKAAGVRARKAINEIRKLASKYRSTQLAESKQV